MLLMALGDPRAENCRCLSIDNGRLSFRSGGRKISTNATIAPGLWTHVAVSSDGSDVTLFADGRRVSSGAAQMPTVPPKIAIAPPAEGHPHFGGSLVEATVEDRALNASQVAALVHARPRFELVQMWNVGVGWE
jgi:hypothetical protein